MALQILQHSLQKSGLSVNVVELFKIWWFWLLIAADDGPLSKTLKNLFLSVKTVILIEVDSTGVSVTLSVCFLLCMVDLIVTFFKSL